MTFTRDGARFKKRPRNPWLLPLVIAVEAALSFFLYVSFAAHTLWPEDTRAAAGIASVLSYEGRLMDASGNPLGGTGTAYCFRFSIYDAASGGTKLWPAGTPATTMATSTDGVFSALVGQADSLTYNFFDNDTVFLNVDVNTTATTCGGSWESLSPRQRIAATGYAQAAKNTYGGSVQVGTGIGGGSPSFLSLDVKNTSDYVGQSCTTSGTMWYNSAISKALVCENGTIQTIGNSSATTTLAAINANTGTPATTGTIVFSNSNGVTFGINGNTITASVNAGGGGAQTISRWPMLPDVGWATSAPVYTGASANTGASTQFTASGNIWSVPFPEQLEYQNLDMILAMGATVAGTGSASIGQLFGIYTLNGNSALSLVTSYMWNMQMSQNSVTARSHYWWWGTNSTSNSSSAAGNISVSYSTNRVIRLLESNNQTLAPGNYYFAHIMTLRTSSSNIYSVAGIGMFSGSQTTHGSMMGRNNLSQRNFGFGGIFSVTTNTNQITGLAMPTSIHTSVITNTANVSQWRTPYVIMHKSIT